MYKGVSGLYNETKGFNKSNVDLLLCTAGLYHPSRTKHILALTGITDTLTRTVERSGTSLTTHSCDPYTVRTTFVSSLNHSYYLVIQKIFKGEQDSRG